jgi:hypothetical protein
METLRFRGKHPIPRDADGNTVPPMVGIWFVVLVAAFIAAGVLTQLGWEMRPMPAVKRVLRRGRSRVDQRRQRHA